MSIYIPGYGEKESQLHNQSLPPFGMYHATSNKKLYEPQRTTDFELVVPLDADWKDIMTNTPIGPEAGEIIRYSVVSVSLPHYEVGVQKQVRGNSVQHFAGVAQWSQGSLVVRDWIGAGSKSILLTWLNQAYDVKTDKTGLLEDYKRDCTLIEYTPDRQVVREWTLFGCWVSKVDEEGWDHTSDNGERKCTADLIFDRAEVNPV